MAQTQAIQANRTMHKSTTLKQEYKHMILKLIEI
jgi:hypothetical protein